MLKHHELTEIRVLTEKLVRMRLEGCKHLCVENIGPEIFATLLREYINACEPTFKPLIRNSGD